MNTHSWTFFFYGKKKNCNYHIVCSEIKYCWKRRNKILLWGVWGIDIVESWLEIIYLMNIQLSYYYNLWDGLNCMLSSVEERRSIDTSGFLYWYAIILKIHKHNPFVLSFLYTSKISKRQYFFFVLFFLRKCRKFCDSIFFYSSMELNKIEEWFFFFSIVLGN